MVKLRFDMKSQSKNVWEYWPKNLNKLDKQDSMQKMFWLINA